MGFLDNLSQNTLNLVGKLSQMPRASTQPNYAAATLGSEENAATNALKIAAQEQADDRKDKRSVLNQLAAQKSLYDLKQQYSDEEEKKRLERLAAMSSELNTIRQKTGKEPSLNQKLELGMKYGLPTDDMKVIAGGGRSGTGNSGNIQVEHFKDNGVEKSAFVTRDEEGNTKLIPFASNPLTTETDRANQRAKIRSDKLDSAKKIAGFGGYLEEIDDPEKPGYTKKQNFYDWVNSPDQKNNPYAQDAKRELNEYLSLTNNGTGQQGFNKYIDELNIEYAISKNPKLTYSDAQRAVNKAKIQKIPMPYSYSTGDQSGAQQGTSGATGANGYDQIKASIEGGAQPTGTNRSMVAKAIPGTSQMETNQQAFGNTPISRIIDSGIKSAWGGIKNMVTHDATKDWEALQPTQTKTSDTQQPSATSQWVDSLKSTDYWKKNSEQKGFGTMAASYAKTMLQKDNDLTDDEKEEAWKKLKNEYGTGNAKKIWDRTGKSLGYE